jgi:hypothetical protein
MLKLVEIEYTRDYLEAFFLSSPSWRAPAAIFCFAQYISIYYGASVNQGFRPLDVCDPAGHPSRPAHGDTSPTGD